MKKLLITSSILVASFFLPMDSVKAQNDCKTYFTSVLTDIRELGPGASVYIQGSDNSERPLEVVFVVDLNPFSTSEIEAALSFLRKTSKLEDIAFNFRILCSNPNKFIFRLKDESYSATIY